MEKESEVRKMLDILKVKDIRFVDSHETLLSLDGWSGDDDAVSLNNSISIARNDPERKDHLFIAHPRYEMTFSENETDFFRAVYILEVTYQCTDPDEVMKLFEVGEVKKYFFKTQMNHDLWPILRSRIINAFANHSLKPIVLPWLLPIKNK